MEVFVVCNTGYEEREFICAFSTFDKALEYVNKKWGQYDNIVIYKHSIDSIETGLMVYEQQCAHIRNTR